MKIPTLYLDTSVIGGYFDDEFKTATRELFRQSDLGIYKLFASVVTEVEIQSAPANIQRLFANTFEARKTAGMPRSQVLAFFNRDQSLSRMQACRKRLASPAAAH